MQRWMANSVGGGYDEEDGERLQLEGGSVHEREDNESLGQAPLSTDEDNAVNSDSDGPLVNTMTSMVMEFFVKERKRKTRQDVYDPRVDHATIKLKVVQRFKDAAECKGVVRKWAITNGYNLCLINNTSKQLDVRCHEGCNWRLYVSMLRHEKTFVIKTLTDVHTCYRIQHNRHVNIEFMDNEFRDKFERNPFCPMKEWS